MQCSESVRIEDAIRIIRHPKKVKRSDYLIYGKYPIIDQSKDFIAGYTNESCYLYTGGLPVVLFGDHTRILKLIEFPFCIGADGTQLFLNREGIDIYYLFYALKSLSLKNYGYERHFKYLKEEAIPIHDVEIQKRIGKYLRVFDSQIHFNQSTIAALEQIAQFIYREWFVHFRFPGHEDVEMMDSELGLIPEGWKVETLGENIQLKYGKSLTKKDRLIGEYPVYGSSGIVGNHSDYIVNGPGVILGRKGNVGSVFISRKDFFPIDTVFYVESSLSMSYVYHLLRSLAFLNNDSAVPGLNREAALMKKVIVPPMGLIDHFGGIADPLYEHIDILNNKNDVLSSIKGLFLPKLISGEIDISGFDIEIAEEVMP
jgi:type I restriction enzyme S subunit